MTKIGKCGQCDVIGKPRGEEVNWKRELGANYLYICRNWYDNFPEVSAAAAI
jgi:hypothetical protein